MRLLKGTHCGQEVSEEPWWNKFPHWLDDTNTRVVCGKCAKNMGWIELYYNENKKPCFMCDGATGNRVPLHLTKHNKWVLSFKGDKTT